MAILRFRVYFEEDESVYRDVVIRHSQSFLDFHDAILRAYEFDNKHKATFYRSNDHWLRGREISLEKYDKDYKAAPLLMQETTIGSEIRDPNQKFIYQYDFNDLFLFRSIIYYLCMYVQFFFRRNFDFEVKTFKKSSSLDLSISSNKNYFSLFENYENEKFPLFFEN